MLKIVGEIPHRKQGELFVIFFDPKPKIKGIQTILRGDWFVLFGLEATFGANFRCRFGVVFCIDPLMIRRIAGYSLLNPPKISDGRIVTVVMISKTDETDESRVYAVCL